MKPKVSPELEPDEPRSRRISAVVPRSADAPKVTSGLRPAVRPPLPPRLPALPSPLPARRPEELADLIDDDPDATSEITAVESVSAQLVSASRDDVVPHLASHDDPPTRETPVDTQAVLRAVAAQGLPMPTGGEDRSATPTVAAAAPISASPPLPSMFARPDPTPRMKQALVPPPPPRPARLSPLSPVIAKAPPVPPPLPASSRPMTPPPFPAMRPSAASVPAIFAPLPDLPSAFAAPPASRSSVPPPVPSSLAAFSSSLPAAPPSTPSFVSGVPSSRRIERPATGAFMLPHPAARQAYLRGSSAGYGASTWRRNLGLVAIAIGIAATMVGLAHVITGGTIWLPQ